MSGFRHLTKYLNILLFPVGRWISLVPLVLPLQNGNFGKAEQTLWCRPPQTSRFSSVFGDAACGSNLQIAGAGSQECQPLLRSCLRSSCSHSVDGSEADYLLSFAARSSRLLGALFFSSRCFCRAANVWSTPPKHSREAFLSGMCSEQRVEVQQSQISGWKWFRLDCFQPACRLNCGCRLCSCQLRG